MAGRDRKFADDDNALARHRLDRCRNPATVAASAIGGRLMSFEELRRRQDRIKA
ncbi:MAG: hypothetical protein JF611_08005 [Betaproteobacteria bacterium]|jgi:hypothetical protein|nr:hypothetical protein [Betaproteobacteria bacterium]